MYDHFPKSNISYQGTLGRTYEYPIYGHFSKINISYQGTPGRRKLREAPRDPNSEARGVKGDSRSLPLKGDYLPEA